MGPLVETRHGKVEGVREDDLSVFRGIPFARPPAGELSAVPGFAAGDPAHPGPPSWPAYDATRRATMVFDATCRVEDDPLGAERRVWEDAVHS